VSRIAATFERLRARGERALVAYVTAGDPSLETTVRLAVEMARRGADIVELGVPFSDPLADGPVIQRAAQRALADGTTLAGVLESVARIRAEVQTPIALMTYYNPLLAFGLAAFADRGSKAGVDAVLVVDLPPEEAAPLVTEADRVGLDVVHFVAPTSTRERVRLIARQSRGFIYLVSLTGVTGQRADLPADLEEQVRALRLVTTKPICVGFGIGRPEQVAAVGRLVDGVIVGSAIARLVEERSASPRLIADIGDFVSALKQPLLDAAGQAGSGAGRQRAPRGPKT
jgi:tryptophan synthase alpha chain